MGSIAAAIWSNQSEKSGTWYSVKFSRLFKSGAKWGRADNFSRDDLLILSKVAEHAFEWIHEQLKAHPTEPVDGDSTPHHI